MPYAVRYSRALRKKVALVLSLGVSACVAPTESTSVRSGSHTFAPSTPCVASAGCNPDQQQIDVDAGTLLIDGGEIQDGWIVPSTQSISIPRAAWIANSEEGTVSKIDIDLRREVARYPSVLNHGEPGGGNGVLPWDYTPMCGGTSKIGNCPSRTAVDQKYNAYVANRAYAAQGSVTKFQHDTTTCPDRDGDGVIRTSHDANGDGAIDVTDSVEFPGQDDDCVLWTTNVGPPGAGLRSIVVSLPEEGEETGDLWMPYFAYSNKYGVTQIDTDTGAVIADHGIGSMAPYLASEGKRGFGSYGATTGLRDPQNRIWMVRRRWPSLTFQVPPYTSEVGLEHLIASIDPATGSASLPPIEVNPAGAVDHEGYGITSAADGTIWFGTKGTSLADLLTSPARLIAYHPVETEEHAAATVVSYPMPMIETGDTPADYNSLSYPAATCHEKSGDPTVWRCFNASSPPTSWRTWMPESAGLAASLTDIWIALREKSGEAPPLPAGQHEERGGRILAKFNLASKKFTYYPTPFGSPTGVGVGPDGLIWTVQFQYSTADGHVMAFDPDAEQWVTMGGSATALTTLAGPGTYTYSDFIGYGVNELVGNATVQFVIDGCGDELGTTWSTFSFDSDIPSGASMMFYFRTASSPNDFSGPGAPEWQGPFPAVSPIDLRAAPGPLAPLGHLHVRVEMQSGPTAPPRIKELAAGTLCSALE